MRVTVKHMNSVRRMRAEGFADRAIADALGLSYTTIWSIRQDMGLPNIYRARKPDFIITILEDGFCGTYTECAKHVGIKVAAFKQRVYRHPERFIKERAYRRRAK